MGSQIMCFMVLEIFVSQKMVCHSTRVLKLCCIPSLVHVFYGSQKFGQSKDGMLFNTSFQSV